MAGALIVGIAWLDCCEVEIGLCRRWNTFWKAYHNSYLVHFIRCFFSLHRWYFWCIFLRPCHATTHRGCTPVLVWPSTDPTSPNKGPTLPILGPTQPFQRGTTHNLWCTILHLRCIHAHLRCTQFHLWHIHPHLWCTHPSLWCTTPTLRCTLPSMHSNTGCTLAKLGCTQPNKGHPLSNLGCKLLYQRFPVPIQLCLTGHHCQGRRLICLTLFAQRKGNILQRRKR